MHVLENSECEVSPGSETVMQLMAVSIVLVFHWHRHVVYEKQYNCFLWNFCVSSGKSLELVSTSV